MEYTIQNKKISITVSSSGGELKQIAGADKTEYLWTGSAEYWPACAPHLFPLIGRLHEERYTYENRSYPLSIHGFLKDSEMIAESQGEDFLIFRLGSNKETLKQYPFEFNLGIEYRLAENTIEIIYNVYNLDQKTMFFAIGGHPGFNVPLEVGLTFEDYYLEFSESSSPRRAEPTATNLLNGVFLDYPLKDGRIINLSHELFESDAIILKDMPSSITLKSDKGNRAVRVDYPDFKYLGLWHTVRSKAPFVCIEPWTALQGFEGEVLKLEKSPDLKALKPGEEYRNEWTITIYE